MSKKCKKDCKNDDQCKCEKCCFVLTTKGRGKHRKPCHKNDSSSSSSSSSSESDCNKERYNCKNRNFVNHSAKLRCELGKLQQKSHCPCKQRENNEEKKYKTYAYNGEFHKTLEHNTSDGRLITSANYENMRDAILGNKQNKLNNVPLAPSSEMKLVNPLGSLATPLVGAPSCLLNIDVPPALSSDAGAADLVELYCHAYARDVPFINYTGMSVDAIISQLLGNTYMNKPDILANLRYKPTGSFTGKTLFRGISTSELVGPYISQFAYLKVPLNIALIDQTYSLPPVRYASRVEWGISRSEMIQIQNGIISTLPAAAAPNTNRYVWNGRTLAEFVHQDPPFHIFYNAALMLAKLGANPNPGFPVYANQTGFVTGVAAPSIQCAIAEVTNLALMHAWYWKWQTYRRLRPETMSLWVDNVRNIPTLPNTGNFDLSNVVLNHAILPNIETINNTWGASPTSCTLPLCYREGAPIHPAYPSGYAALSGAGATILKIFYDTEQTWGSLPGVLSGVLSGTPGAVVQADATGAALVSYTDVDASALSIEGEINKLASNVAIGRDWAGVHYRSDGMQGILLGEQVAIKYMEDKLSSMVENNLNHTVPQITFKKFDGTHYTIKPTICKRKC